MTNVVVYTLSSTRDHAVRYIGQTINPAARMRQHLSYASLRRATPVHKWINREREQGFVIVMSVIRESATLHTTEVAVIAEYRAMGCRLLNLTDGGEGTVGWHGNAGNKRPDLAERNRALKGRPGRASTPEANAKIAAAHRGKKKPHVSERNRSMAGKPGHAHTDESRAKIGAALKGRTYSPETIEKMRRAALRRHQGAAA